MENQTINQTTQPLTDRQRRSAIFKDLSANVSMRKLCEVLGNGCAPADVKHVLIQCEKDCYLAANPVDTALCWGCKWCLGGPDETGKRCPWACNLQHRPEWIRDVNYSISNEGTELERLCVKKCDAFKLYDESLALDEEGKPYNVVRLEKKFAKAMLVDFYGRINKELFPNEFFVKASVTRFRKWLNLYNQYRGLVGLLPIVTLEYEDDEELTEEDLAVLKELESEE